MCISNLKELRHDGMERLRTDLEGRTKWTEVDLDPVPADCLDGERDVLAWGTGDKRLDGEVNSQHPDIVKPVCGPLHR